ncbi:MFS-type transporter SLC18B1-like isoform X2 [Ptychodera flava]|uniref:MFS-type transporter SLC18B1-like isoform X2 n=1 Tax=Ptychodera flava TaxID=63121 RepID=UPI00396A6DCC
MNTFNRVHTTDSQQELVTIATNLADEENTDGSIQDHTGSDSSAKSRAFTRRQKLTLLSISLGNLADFISFSILAPFYPAKANDMGASDTIVGLVFGCFALVMFLTSPIFGKFLPQLGAKFLFLSGLFTSGISVIIFGFLDKLNPGTEFIVFCFIVRVVEGVGASASATASFAIIAQTFPDNVSTVFGIIEIFTGLGFMIGPPVGGYLYQVGGYSLPFLVLGSCTVLVVLVNYFVLPQQGESDRPESGSILRLLKTPSIVVTSFCVLAGAMGVSFLDPTLANHLQQFHLDTTAVGLMFLIISASYTIASFFWGYMTDKFDIPKLMMILGNIGSCAAYLYLGPSPILNTKSQLWLAIISMVLLGLSLGSCLVPTFYDLIVTARWHGMPDNLGTYGVVSGLFNSLFSLGNFIGPTFGGILVDVVGFSWAATVFSGVYLFVALLLIVFSLWEYQCGKGRRVPIHQSEVATSVNQESDLNDPLLSD